MVMTPEAASNGHYRGQAGLARGVQCRLPVVKADNDQAVRWVQHS
jgi:hypothetical protein